MKKTIVFLIGFYISFVAISQNEDYAITSNIEKNKIEILLSNAANDLKSFKANFTQIKQSNLFVENLEQYGIMYYKSNDNQLRWEYIKPEKFFIIYNKDNLYIKKDNKIIENPNKAFNELMSFIINTINGKSFKDNKNFAITYYKSKKDNSSVLISMKPISNRIKKMYSLIEIYIDTKTYTANTVILKEVNEDITSIYFKEKQINQVFDNSVFKIQ